MQVFFEIGPEIRKLFKMAVMVAAIFEALGRQTAQIKYAKPNYKGFFATNFISMFNYPQNKPNLWELQPLKNDF